MNVDNPTPSTSSAIIREFNAKAGLLQRGYHARLEASFQIEEALEGLPLRHIVSALDPAQYMPYSSAKHLSRKILEHVDSDVRVTLVEAIDKAADAIVFAYGSLFKLGLSVQQAEDLVTIVSASVMEKVSAPVDEQGKLTKPEGFVGPEERIAEYLRDIGEDPERKV